MYYRRRFRHLQCEGRDPCKGRLTCFPFIFGLNCFEFPNLKMRGMYLSPANKVVPTTSIPCRQGGEGWGINALKKCRINSGCLSPRGWCATLPFLMHLQKFNSYQHLTGRTVQLGTDNALLFRRSTIVVPALALPLDFLERSSPYQKRGEITYSLQITEDVITCE